MEQEGTTRGDTQGSNFLLGLNYWPPSKAMYWWKEFDPGEVDDEFGRTHDIPNLFCCDGSIFPTQGSANPGLTIQAMAARIADYLITERDNILSRRPGSLREPPIMHELPPPGVYTRGIPRLS